MPQHLFACVPYPQLVTDSNSADKVNVSMNREGAVDVFYGPTGENSDGVGPSEDMKSEENVHLQFHLICFYFKVE